MENKQITVKHVRSNEVNDVFEVNNYGKITYKYFPRTMEMKEEDIQSELNETQNYITENNALISEFMGWIKGEMYSEEQPFYCAWNEGDINQLLPHEMEFHTSWDWLMPVIAKCTEIGYANENNEIDAKWEELIGDNQSMFLGNHLEECYENAVEFIKWYSQEPFDEDHNSSLMFGVDNNQ